MPWRVGEVCAFFILFSLRLSVFSNVSSKALGLERAAVIETEQP